ncbi:hypothetical protein M427DRAFT_32359 [Gonapodya prolifera JEL478]|uniref:Ferric oxidoreductase domain-containing protein n=1 Tax=Gonapodya prolifera (strain JEL478) TaxID=1344416 RepID=A0A139AF65_GONPJ|nr:hypothetical protein M427DRAFT_32359 [Gonapodya prolifera JEL478]|eukprot:KXS15398.1 hypothetical protein M427DRAFT_32359 [Gonapodya prolifera JEL478]
MAKTSSRITLLVFYGWIAIGTIVAIARTSSTHHNVNRNFAPVRRTALFWAMFTGKLTDVPLGLAVLLAVKISGYRRIFGVSFAGQVFFYGGFNPGAGKSPPKYGRGSWQSAIGIYSTIMFIPVAVMSLPIIRRKRFELFYYTHFLVFPAMFLAWIHAAFAQPAGSPTATILFRPSQSSTNTWAHHLERQLTAKGDESARPQLSFRLDGPFGGDICANGYEKFLCMAGTGLSPAVGVARTAISSKGVSGVIVAWVLRDASGVERISLIGVKQASSELFNLDASTLRLSLDLFEEGKKSNVGVRISVYSTPSKVNAQEHIDEKVTLQENEDQDRESPRAVWTSLRPVLLWRW